MLQDKQVCAVPDPLKEAGNINEHRLSVRMWLPSRLCLNFCFH